MSRPLPSIGVLTPAAYPAQMTDWVTTVSALATGGGTLVLAIATFASVRSANRAARVAEASLLSGLRPLLMHSLLQDPEQKLTWGDAHWERLPGGGAVATVTPEAVYLALSLRNAGNGLAVLHGWRFRVGRQGGPGDPHPPLEEFTRQGRDMYIAPSAVGFWQAALRDPAAAEFATAAAAVKDGRLLSVDLLYGDFEGGQRMISRFNVTRGEKFWIAEVTRHWNVDRPDPR
jgi:hypothetical protein